MNETAEVLSFLRGAWTQLHQLSQDIELSSQHCTFVSEFGYLAAFSNAGGSKLSNVLNDAKFYTFWPPVKIRRRIGEISTNCWSYQTSEIHLTAIHCVATEHGGLTKNKEKESSWVKLKAFPTNVGRPNKGCYAVQSFKVTDVGTNRKTVCKSAMLRWSPYVFAKFGEVGSTQPWEALSVLPHLLK